MELMTGFSGNSVLGLTRPAAAAHARGNSVGGVFAAKASAFRYWVDAKTFQPAEMQFPPFTPASTVTVTWLPKTPALVHQTNAPHVPAGCRKVTAPAGFR
jgi:hypothetical protein